MPYQSSPLHVQTGRTIAFPPSQRPVLVVVIDCEEGFDWQRPLRGTQYSLESTRRLGPVQQVFEELGVIPIYVVGYPIVDHETAWQPLARLMEQGKCLIGAHLHPWVTPPHLEISNLRNSFPGNLPRELELAKLRTLTDRITDRFGSPPTVYKAGRYGFGPGTVAALRELGFQVDVSFMPHWDFKAESGPSFLEDNAAPFWLDDEKTLLEMPATTGFTGSARSLGPRSYRQINTRLLRALRVTAVLARTGVLNRVRLTPEGVPLEEAKALTRSLLKDGHRVFQMAFHSTSLVPGSTQYVSSERELDCFIDWIRQYITFFRSELAGVPVVPEQVLAFVRQSHPRLEGIAAAAGDVPASREPMHILLCCNAAYMQHLAVLVTSLAEQPTAYRINIVVAMDQVREHDIDAVRETLARYPHVTLNFRTFSADADLFLPIRAHYSRDIYTRLWVAEFFEETVERVLYLDCDMVVVGSLDALWEAPLAGHTIGAVSIPGSTRCAHLEIPEASGYFNSGVLLIDLVRWRNTGAFGRLIDYIISNSDKLIDPDQDALNATLHADRMALDYVWNVTSPFYFDYHDLRLPAAQVHQIQADARIIHFNGASKPWSYFSRHPRRQDYFKYLMMTSWRDFQPADRTAFNRVRRFAASLVPDTIRRAGRDWLRRHIGRDGLRAHGG
ncbi:MAG: glycosyltransferase [Rhodospirillales bacterium]